MSENKLLDALTRPQTGASNLFDRLIKSVNWDDIAPDDGTVEALRMEKLANATYALGTRRLDYVMQTVLPSQIRQLRTDTARAKAWAEMKPDYSAAFAGPLNASNASAATSLRELYHALDRYNSRAFQAHAFSVMMNLVSTNALSFGLVRASEHERVRGYRDAGWDMLYRHVELLAGISAVGESIGNAGRADVANAARDRMNERIHKQNMVRLNWEREKKLRELKDARDGDNASMLGALGGKFLSGVKTGYTFGKS